MAIIKFGGGILDARGSIGGNVFSRNRYGAYMRARTKPVNPNTQKQSDARAVMSDVSKDWFAVLSQAQRDAWGQYAANMPAKNALGEVIYLSGYNQYVKSNVALANAGLAAVSDAPATYVLPGEDTSFAVAASEATQELSITFDATADWAGEDGGAMIIRQGIPVGDSISYFDGPWRNTAAIEGDGTTPPTSPATVASEYQMVAGQQIFVEARIVQADGRLGDWFRSSAICAA